MRVPAPLADTVLWSVDHAPMRVLTRRGVRRDEPLSVLIGDAAAREDPGPTIERIRQAGDLYRGAVVSATASHAVAAQVLRSEDFGVAVGRGALPAWAQRLLAAMEDEHALGPVDPPSLLGLDPPDHTRLRKLVSRAFTARRVAAMEDDVRAITRRLLADLPAAGEVDLVGAFASRLPVAVIADLLGVPDDEHDQLLAWGNSAALQLDGGLAFGDYHRSRRAVRRMHHWFAAHLRRLAADPGDDVLSGVIEASAELPPAERPTELELRAVGLLVLGAGFETTVNLIGNAVALLDRHPDQLAALQAEPAGWGGAVEEVLRYDPPVQFNARVARADTEVAGHRLQRGHVVLILTRGVNRDPAVFSEPHTFDVTRTDADQHLSFSTGAHFCLGAGLARLEARVALSELYAEYPRLRVSGDPVRRATRVLRGYERLPVRLA